MYKKGIVMLLIVTIAFILGACGAKEETRTFEYEENGIISTLTFYYEGDKVTKQTSENVVPYESVGISSKEEAKEMFDPLFGELEDVEGINQTMDYSDTEITEKIEVDFKKLDTDEAKRLSIMVFEGESTDSISMKKTAETLINQGFVEK